MQDSSKSIEALRSPPDLAIAPRTKVFNSTSELDVRGRTAQGRPVHFIVRSQTSDSVMRREKYAVLPSRVSRVGPMTSRVTEKILRTCLDWESTMKNAFPYATNSTRRPSGSHTGHSP